MYIIQFGAMNMNFLQNKIPICGRCPGGLENGCCGRVGSESLESSLGTASWEVGSPGAEPKEPRQEGTKEGPRPAGTAAKSPALSLNG